MAGAEAAIIVLGAVPPQAGLCISVRKKKQNTELGTKKSEVFISKSNWVNTAWLKSERGSLMSVFTEIWM